MNAPSTPAAGDASLDAELQQLLEDVARQPWAHDFHALIRRIDCLRPQAPPLGEALRPRQEVLRLGQAPELDFAPAAIASLQFQPETPPRLKVRFFGLLGPHGAMPLHLTEFVRERLRHHDDPTLAHFLDLFHHRMLSLFHRAWAQSRPVVHLDRPRHDRFGVWLSALAGGMQRGTALPEAALIHHSGWLSGRSAHPQMLEKMIGQVFGVPARVQEHIGHWMALPEGDRARLGHARDRSERSLLPASRLPGRTQRHHASGLAGSAHIGSRVWDRQCRFRLQLGPLPRQTFEELLPGGDAWPALTQLVRLVAGRDKRWDLCLQLRPDQRPPPTLNGRLRLGVTSWLGRCAAPGIAPSGADSGAVGPGAAPFGLRLRPATTFLVRRPRGLPQRHPAGDLENG